MSAEDIGAVPENLVRRACGLGADESEAWLTESTHLSARVRFGQVETLTEATSRALSFRHSTTARCGNPWTLRHICWTAL